MPVEQSLSDSETDPDSVPALELESNNASHDAISNILSQDVLQEIFDITIDDLEHHHRSPLAIGSVCKTWRDIVWNYPPLWRHLCIYLPKVEGPETAFQREMVRGWLERSGRQTLNITLVGSLIKLGHSDQRYSHRHVIAGWEPSNEICDILLAVADRWESFAINGEAFENLRPKLDQHQFPLLICVAFHSMFEDTKPWTLMSAPALEEVYLTGYADASAYTMPWRQCSLLCCNFTVEGFISVLRESCSSSGSHPPSSVLEKAYITLMDDWWPDPQNGTKTPFLLPNLTLLVLKVGKYAGVNYEISAFFDNVQLPALTYLDVTLDGILNNVDDNFSPRFVGFLQRSGCPLRSLILGFPAFKDEASLRNILRETPHLESLYMESHVVDLFSGIINIIDLDGKTPTGEECRLLPRLECLSYKGRIFPRPNLNEIIRVLKSRFAASTSTTRGPSRSGLGLSEPASSGSQEIFETEVPSVVKLTTLTVHCTATSERISERRVTYEDEPALELISAVLEEFSSSEGVKAVLNWDDPYIPVLFTSTRSLRS